MKRLLFIATIFVAFSLTSCLSDDDPVQYYLELGTLSGETAKNFVINTDFGNVLKPQGAVPGLSKFEDGKRVQEAEDFVFIRAEDFFRLVDRNKIIKYKGEKKNE